MEPTQQPAPQTPETPPTPDALSQPTPPVAAPAPTNLAPTPAAEDPGKVLGIVGLVFTFIGLSLVGLILSIVARSKSKKAGFHNTVALVGIIINAIFVGLAVLLIPLYFAIATVSYNGISERANSSAAQSAAASVAKEAEYYAYNTGEYPLYSGDIADQLPSVTFSTEFITTAPEDPYTVELQACSDGGNKVGYWDYDYNSIAYLYTGESSATSACVLAAY